MIIREKKNMSEDNFKIGIEYRINFKELKQPSQQKNNRNISAYLNTHTRKLEKFV